MIEAPEVVFDEEAHTYTLAGVTCPRSVTGLLKKYGLTTDYSQIPARIMDVARQRGVAYAEGRRLILQGYELDPFTIDLQIQGYLAAFQSFWKDSGATLIETEIPRISPLGFAFKADIYAFINGRRIVIDDKCTATIPKSAGPQTAGYKIGRTSVYPHEPIEDRAVLWVKPDGTYKFKLLDDPDDETAFMDCLDADIKLMAWQNKYGGKSK
jgi:hypothetical protein